MVDLGGSGGGALSAAAQQYCLKWNNHQNNLLRVFIRLLGQEQFTDVTIASEGRRIKCHKMVLSACSSYFEQLFSAYNEPNQIVILKDTPYQDIAAIVEFMYKGEINVSQDRLSSLLKTAENLKVKGLAEVSGDDSKSGPGRSNNNNSINNNGVDPTSHNGAPRPLPRAQGPPPMQMMGRPGMSTLSDALMNGDSKQRKRGRPRTLDGPEDDINFSPRISSVHGNVGVVNPLVAGLSSREGSTSPFKAGTPSPFKAGTPSPFKAGAPSPFKHRVLGSNPTTHGMSPLQAALNRPISSPSERASTSPPTTPPSPAVKLEAGEAAPQEYRSSAPHQEYVQLLSQEKIESWGVVKMNDYLVAGTRQQYWEEIFVKHVMESVKNKEIDMKGAAEILGVSYGTLYGRYRENFGYLKHAWNLSGRPTKKMNLWSDPNTKAVLESMRSGNINIKQAAEALGMEPALLAYQLAGKVPGGDDDEDIAADEEEEEMDMSEMMEVQPEIILGGDTERKQEEYEQFDSIVEEVD